MEFLGVTSHGRRSSPAADGTRLRRGSPTAPTGGGLVGGARAVAQRLASTCSREEEGKMMLRCTASSVGDECLWVKNFFL
jgi:hypothetical protein